MMYCFRHSKNSCILKLIAKYFMYFKGIFPILITKKILTLTKEDAHVQEIEKKTKVKSYENIHLINI